MALPPSYTCVLQYFAVEVRGPKPPKRQAIFALTPHGVFPFPLGLAAVGRLNSAVFNNLRPIVASATRLFPVIGHLVKLIDCVDASAPSVHDALEKGRSLGLHPGGIGAPGISVCLLFLSVLCLA
jgi:hypothetical protein